MFRSNDIVPRADRYAELFAPAVVDLFAGCGGWSIGAERAFVRAGYRDRYIDLMVNHWEVAVGVHQANHPMTEHLHASVFEVDPSTVLPGRRIAYLHASPDCTHFSKARGSRPKKKEIRGLAWVVVDWAAKRRPDVITLENVEEFRTWGPLGRDGQPCARRKGQTFRQWIRKLETLGYEVEHRELRACDYGAPTTRKRLFVIARCDGKPIVWPAPSHGLISSTHELQKRHRQRKAIIGSDGQSLASIACHRCAFRGGADGPERHPRDTPAARPRSFGREAQGSGRLAPYRTAAECIDWSIPMLSIFATPAEAKAFAVVHGCGVPRRPLKEKTLARIAAGLVKFVINAKRPFLVDIENAGWATSGNRGVDTPLNTITAQPKGGKHAVVDVAVAPIRVSTDHTKTTGRGRYFDSVEEPLKTVTASNGHAIAAATLSPFIGQLAHGGGGTFGDGRSNSVNEPLGTVHAGGNNHALVGATLAPYTVPNLGERPVRFRCRSCGHEFGPWKPDDEHDAGMCPKCFEQEKIEVIDGQAPRCGSVEAPLPTVTAKGNGARLVAATLQTLNHDGPEHRGQSPADPLHTVTSTRDARALVAAMITKHYGGVVGHAADQPVDTVTAKDHNAVTVAHLIKFRGQSPGTPADAPIDTITAGPGGRSAGSPHAMGVSAVYLSHLYGTNRGTNGDATEPIGTVTGTGNHAALVAAFLATYFSQGSGKTGQPIDAPAPTIVGKDRIQLVTVLIDGQTYVITDIAMRMLQPHELKRAQGFPDDYVIDRTQDGTPVSKADQVKLIGNSVPPQFAEAIVYENVIRAGVLDDAAIAAGVVA